MRRLLLLVTVVGTVAAASLLAAFLSTATAQTGDRFVYQGTVDGLTVGNTGVGSNWGMWPPSWLESLLGPFSPIRITVMNTNTFTPIQNRQTIGEGTPFQVKVTSNGVDCAGQLVVTALGAIGLPPSVLVDVESFIIGPAVGTNAVTGPPLTAGGFGNDFKISATCNGAKPAQFAHASFEFFVEEGSP
jgi:hypothetical protein